MQKAALQVCWHFWMHNSLLWLLATILDIVDKEHSIIVGSSGGQCFPSCSYPSKPVLSPGSAISNNGVTTWLCLKPKIWEAFLISPFLNAMSASSVSLIYCVSKTYPVCVHFSLLPVLPRLSHPPLSPRCGCGSFSVTCMLSLSPLEPILHVAASMIMKKYKFTCLSTENLLIISYQT